VLFLLLLKNYKTGLTACFVVDVNYIAVLVPAHIVAAVLVLPPPHPKSGLTAQMFAWPALTLTLSRRERGIVGM